MRILIVFATTEGQTAKIAHYAFARLTADGHSVALLSAAEARDLDPASFDRVLLAGSVHAGRYQEALKDYMRAQRASLSRAETLFLSVSLSAAGSDPDDWKGLKDCVRRLTEETGVAPKRVEHVAGAFRFSDYGFFEYWAMRWIATQKDDTVEHGEDREYTDWTALAALLDDWAS
ncbi:protoporphyrinogen oxidase [Rhodobacteraceae bacterium CCMM004]|nr:protoporphyrinogen oxidase [Rhodobacteraceae bacterium CCMM004]